MKLSMIVEITSCAPVLARNQPGIAPQKAPPRNPARMAMGRWTIQGRPVIMNPAMTAVMPPIVIWPSAPMLNRPARNPMATAKPARISGAEVVKVSDIDLIPTKAPRNKAR
jgi:hypothetical protein